MSSIDSGRCGDDVARRTKRLLAADEKRSICLRTATPSDYVVQMARCYAMNAHLVFKWLHVPRYAPDLAAMPLPAVGPRSLPIEIIAEATKPLAPDGAAARPVRGTSLCIPRPPGCSGHRLPAGCPGGLHVHKAAGERADRLARDPRGDGDLDRMLKSRQSGKLGDSFGHTYSLRHVPTYDMLARHMTPRRLTLSPVDSR